MLRRPAFRLGFVLVAAASTLATVGFFADAFPLVRLNLEKDRAAWPLKAHLEVVM